MADQSFDLFNAQTTALATDLLYILDLTEPVELDQNKKLTLSNLATFINAQLTPSPTIVNSDANLYVQWESSANNWAIRRLSDGFQASVNNNPTETTTAGAWTNRATLTYSADGL